MTLLATLKMVRGAVADRDIVPALTHFLVRDGRIQGSNSRIAIDAPLPAGFESMAVAIPADRFIKAIDLCTSEPTLHVEDQRLRLRAGAFTVKFPTLSPADYPHAEPDPDDWQTDEPLLPVLRTLRPFIASDAQQVWPTGVWFDDKSGFGYATNNVTLLRCPCSLTVGTGISINLPLTAIDEMLRFGVEPSAFGVRDNSITFHYPAGQWIKSQLLAVAWPVETLQRLYAGTEQAYAKLPAVPELLAPAVESVLPFCPNPKFPVVQFEPTSVSTEDGEYQAIVEGFELSPAKFNGNMLRLVLEHATHLDPAGSSGRTLFLVGGSGQGILTSLRA
jgi:hypothetical protein